MGTGANYATSYTENLELAWSKLYPSLMVFSRRLVYTLRIPAWYGQEDDIVGDIVQETARRLVERLQKAECGEAEPIASLEHMAFAIARNYCHDLRRRDRRMTHCEIKSLPEIVGVADQQYCLDISEVATEYAHNEALFMLLACEIVNFPSKQRKELLADLANRMCFEDQPTPLQQAFLKVGVRLQEHRQELSTDPKEKARRAALLCYAYKRVARVACMLIATLRSATPGRM